MVQPLTAAQLEEQPVTYTALLQGLGQATFSEIETVLAEREQVAPEPGLTPEVIKALKERQLANSDQP